MAADAWFYTLGGERLGPVPFSDLKIKAIEGALNPRLDMAWTQGMAEWKPMGEIEGIFERKTAAVPDEAPKAAMATAVDPSTPLGDETAAEQMATEGEWPGARRRSYLFATLILPGAWNRLLAFASPTIQGKFGEELSGMILLGAAVVPLLVILFYTVRRFVNLGMSGLWFFGLLVPFLNLWLGYRTFACPAGYAYHKKLDGIGILLAIVYWLSVLLIVVVIGAVTAALLGAWGSPELQQKVQELLQGVLKATEGLETAK